MRHDRKSALNPTSHNATGRMTKCLMTQLVREGESDFKRGPSGLCANTAEGKKGIEMRSAIGPQFKILKVTY